VSTRFRVALIGNPNTGKSTLFNAVAGMRVRTGNYPGVTVEKRTANVTWNGQSIELIDLPGTYSLSPRSPDEMLTVDLLTGCGPEERPDAVICVCDATALERNLFLVSQLAETDVPTIVCLNMWDAAQKQGVRVDQERLATILGVAVVATSASKRTGLQSLRNAVLEQIASHGSNVASHPQVLPSAVHYEVDGLRSWLVQNGCDKHECPAFVVSRGLLDPGGAVEKRLCRLTAGQFESRVADARCRLAADDLDVPAVESRERYRFISDVIAETVTTEPSAKSVTDRLDHVLTSRYFGMLICVAVMLLIFTVIYWVSQPLSDGMENGIGWLSDLVKSSLSPGPLRSLLTSGVLAGVGAVLVFLPQIALLFLFIALLEDCGYMARAAFMMDRLMALVGLSGRSFLPLMSSFACAVPGVMATRVIEDRRDRFVTILIAPLMSCSARLPVYVLMIWTFIPDLSLLGGLLPLRALVLFGMSILGLVIAIPTAWILRKSCFKGQGSPFLLELPDYRLPSPRVVFHRVWESSRSFVVRAGTMIFATAVLVWALGGGTFSGSERYELMTRLEQLDPVTDANDVSQLSQQLNELNAKLLADSPLGMFGKVIEPAVCPLGWDWRIGVGVIASFPAREVIIATMGTIFSLGGDVEEDDGLRDALRSAKRPDGSALFNIPSALALMVFFALCAQCVSTLVVIKRETNSWRWPAISFTYMTILAWVGAFATYQVGMLF
jgi:ferrous iron transport protein B